jgi:hypothetical protein
VRGAGRGGYRVAAAKSKYVVTTTVGTVEFVGWYLPDREKANWHYYMTEKGEVLHFRKDHMVWVRES